MNPSSLSYQVIARKYRPQKFADVYGQQAIVQTLKNALKKNKVAHAYLFSGGQGTGKTTLARILAKALNCEHISSDMEPCTQCSSCKEISLGQSLDVLEIDGASNRGIDDIRQISEHIGVAAHNGKFKIFIIDEVHMLTKEAFNALLKTLEEPPSHVKFFFATTEPHKILPTILSRCQKFPLKRLSSDQILNKLISILNDLHITYEKEALFLIAKASHGGMRDAESLLEQALAFQEGDSVLTQNVIEILGILPTQSLFDLDQAIFNENILFAFDFVKSLHESGKDYQRILEELSIHFRHYLFLLIGGQSGDLGIHEENLDQYLQHQKLFHKQQCLMILQELQDSSDRLKTGISPTLLMEKTLIKVIQSRHLIPIEDILHTFMSSSQITKETQPPVPVSVSLSLPIKTPPPTPPQISVEKNQTPPIEKTPQKPHHIDENHKTSANSTLPPQAIAPPSENISWKLTEEEQAKLDSLMQFSAVELEGQVKKIISKE